MGFWQRLIGEEPSLLQQWLHYDDKGSFGEYLIKYALANIPGYQKLMRNIYVPYNGKTSEIDVLMIHEKGIFVFESKNYSGWIFGGLEDTKWTQCLPNKQKSRFYNPILQNRTHIKALAQFSNIDIERVVSYIIFSQRCELKDVPDSSANCVILKRPDMLKHLKRDIKERSIVYTREEIDSIYNKLLPLTQVTEEQKKQHIENIDNKIRKQTKECENLIPGNVEKLVDESTNSVSIEESTLYKELKKYRLERSKADNVKPYFIYSNAQLEEIANKKPKTLDELKAIKGFGDVKCEKYGGDIVGIVRRNM